jgi:NADP-dependent aldehyde dehydrogenase
VQGNNHEVGMALVQHPLIRAIGFTGSFRGGKAIFDAANRRSVPIPVYAEMGSTNPVFILPGALAEQGKEIARGLTQSATLGVGQFCTNPGLVFLPEKEAAEPFLQELKQQFEEVEGQAMLNAGIQSAFNEGVQQLEVYGLELLAEGKKGKEESYSASARVFHSSVGTFLQNEALEEEVFGPSTITFTSDQKEQLLESARRLQGHLTASLFGTPRDLEENRDLIRILEQKAGRLLINQFPTGVEVCHAMVHGGPFPATTDSRTTSVGTAAIVRFARPICYQNFPENLLPEALKEGNPRKIWRLVDGKRMQ